MRLSYAGEVLRVSGSQLRPERQFGQVGIELIGPAVPAADAEAVLLCAGRRLAELGREAHHRRIDARLAEAMRAGKLVEAQRGWAETMVAREEELFDEWLRTAPVVVVPGSRSIPPSAMASGSSRTHAVEARARSEYRSSPLVSALTSEEAFVADAIRQARE